MEFKERHEQTNNVLDEPICRLVLAVLIGSSGEHDVRLAVALAPSSEDNPSVTKAETNKKKSAVCLLLLYIYQVLMNTSVVSVFGMLSMRSP